MDSVAAFRARVEASQSKRRLAEERNERLSTKRQHMLELLELDEMGVEALHHEIRVKKKDLKQDMKVRAHTRAHSLGKQRQSSSSSSST